MQHLDGCLTVNEENSTYDLKLFSADSKQVESIMTENSENTSQAIVSPDNRTRSKSMRGFAQVTGPIKQSDNECYLIYDPSSKVLLSMNIMFLMLLIRNGVLI
jgi:hypothetical protein